MGNKILLVDDDPYFTQLYSAVFQANGLNFAVANNGAQALLMAKAEQPDLILLDIMLPDMDGMEVLKRLKQDQATAAITIWMITNLAEQLKKDVATSLGAADYLVKASYTPKQVVERINSYFGKTGDSSKGGQSSQNPLR